MDIGTLANELSADPAGIGYAAMTDAEAAAALNVENRTVERGTLSGSTIFNAIVPAEFQSLDASQKQFVRDVFSLGDAVDVGVGTNARDVLLGAFGVQTTTRANLAAAVQVTISRAAELGLPHVYRRDVAKARERIG